MCISRAKFRCKVITASDDELALPGITQSLS